MTLQRPAHVTEAQLYDDVRLPALTQSMNDLRGESQQGLAIKATVATVRAVGAVRVRFDDGVLHACRITVASEQQGKGISSALLQRVERDALVGTKRCAPFTGHLSGANLRLRQRHGRMEVCREALHPGVTLVHPEKAVGVPDAR